MSCLFASQGELSVKRKIAAVRAADVVG
jgi:hypothetical protein